MDLINRSLAESRSRIIDPTFKYIEETVKNNMMLIRKRIHGSARYVKPNHLLYRLLSQLAVNTRMDRSELYYACSDIMYQIANAMGLTSATSVGKVHRNVFMDGCSEIIFIHNTEFEYKAWHQLEPVKFHYHCETNMNGLRGGLGNSETVAIISINVPMLGWMYKEWAAAVKRVGSKENTYNFIAKYVLCNSLYSYFNVSYFNRIYYRLTGQPFDPDKKNGELALNNYDAYADKADLHLLEVLSRGKTSMEEVFFQTQVPFADTLLDMYDAPVVAKTRQVLWCITAYRLPFLHYGLLAQQTGGYLGDSGKLSTLKRQINQQLDVSIIRKNDTPFAKYLLDHWINPIKEIVE